MCAGGQLKDAAVQEERAAERELLVQAIQKAKRPGPVSDATLLCGCSHGPPSRLASSVHTCSTVILPSYPLSTKAVHIDVVPAANAHWITCCGVEQMTAQTENREQLSVHA